MNTNGVFLAFCSQTLPNRWVEFKFGGIETELYARDHVSNAHSLLGNGY